MNGLIGHNSDTRPILWLMIDRPRIVDFVSVLWFGYNGVNKGMWVRECCPFIDYPWPSEFSLVANGIRFSEM